MTAPDGVLDRLIIRCGQFEAESILTRFQDGWWSATNVAGVITSGGILGGATYPTDTTGVSRTPDGLSQLASKNAAGQANAGIKTGLLGQWQTLSFAWGKFVLPQLADTAFLGGVSDSTLLGANKVATTEHAGIYFSAAAGHVRFSASRKGTGSHKTDEFSDMPIVQTSDAYFWYLERNVSSAIFRVYDHTWKLIDEFVETTLADLPQLTTDISYQQCVANEILARKDVGGFHGRIRFTNRVTE